LVIGSPERIHVLFNGPLIWAHADVLRGTRDWRRLQGPCGQLRCAHSAWLRTESPPYSARDEDEPIEEKPDDSDGRERDHGRTEPIRDERPGPLRAAGLHVGCSLDLGDAEFELRVGFVIRVLPPPRAADDHPDDGQDDADALPPVETEPPHG